VNDGGVRTRTGDLGVMKPSTDLRIYWHYLPYTNISNGLQLPRECIYYHYLRPIVIYFRHNLGTS